MARNPYSDYLRAYPFWLMDVGPADSISLPLLTPTFGFSSITAPEITLETHEVIDGNAVFTKTVIKRGSVGNITLAQGITFYNNDFGRWMEAAVVGDTAPVDAIGITGPLPIGGPTFRRDLLLVQYFSHVNLDAGLGGVGTAVAAAALATGAIAASQLAGSGGSVAGLATAGGVVAAAVALGNAKVGPFEFAARVPARAWMLKGCIPVRYKSGTDFDAQSNAISVAEIELAVDVVDEFALGSGLAYGAPLLATF